MGKHLAYLAIAFVLLLTIAPPVAAQSNGPTETLGDEHEPWPPLPGSYPSGMSFYEGERGLSLTQYVPGDFMACGGGYLYERSITAPSEGLSYWVKVGHPVDDRSAWGADRYRIKFAVYTISDVNLPDDLPATVSVFLYSSDWGSTVSMGPYLADQYQGQRLDFPVTRTTKSVWVSTEPDVYETLYYQTTHIDVTLSTTALGFRGQPIVWVGVSGISWSETTGWWPWEWVQNPVRWGIGSVQVIPLLAPNGVDPLEPPPPMCAPPGEATNPTPTPTPSPTPTGTLTPPPTASPTPTPSPTPTGTLTPPPTPRPPIYATSPPPTLRPPATATPYIIRTVAAIATATTIPLPTFAGVAAAGLTFPNIPPATPMPQSTPWQPSALSGGQAMTITSVITAPVAAVGEMVSTPMAMAESMIITGTAGTPGIRLMGVQTVEMIDESAKIFALLGALRWYMPNLWPLILAMLVVLALIFGNRLIKVSVAFFATAIEVIRRIWDAIPFKFS